MIKQLRGIIILIFIIPGIINGQYPDPGPDYQMTMLNNPGLTGSGGDGYIRLSYMNYYPGQGYNLFSGSISYDAYFPQIHGGAGIYLSNDYMGGIINDLQGGFSYAYFFQAGKGLYISAGLSASMYHRGYNFQGSVLPDQIDPVGGFIFPPGETLASEPENALDLGTGMLFITEKVFWGIAVNHLTEPDIFHSDGADGRLGRKLLVHAAGNLSISKEKDLKIRPMGECAIMKGYFSAGAGAVIESKYLSASVLLFGNRERNLDLQAGFALGIGSIEIFYNYRFNLASGSNLLPLSLFHQTGISLGLNNVDKRRIIKTINYPNL